MKKKTTNDDIEKVELYIDLEADLQESEQVMLNYYGEVKNTQISLMLKDYLLRSQKLRKLILTKINKLKIKH